MNSEVAEKTDSLWADSYERLKKNKVAILSGYFIFILIIIAICAEYLSPFAFDEQNIDKVLSPPDGVNFLGTDSLGRDMLSRLLQGAQVSMAVGIYTAFFSLSMGTVYGCISGWIGGKVDSVMMRLIDVLYSIPALILLVLVKVSVDGFLSVNPDKVDNAAYAWIIDYFNENPKERALFSIFSALAIYGWMGMARIVRGQVLQTKEMQYIEAARSLGVKGSGIVIRHILPNIMGPVIVTLTFQIPANVMFESFLSFIGLGLQPPYSSWGVLANEGWRSLRVFPHLILSPGLAIFFSMLAFNMFGDGLRDAFDPKMKK